MHQVGLKSTFQSGLYRVQLLMQESHENSLWEASCTCCSWTRHREEKEVAAGHGKIRFFSWLCG